jgi:hypothetical protein
MNPSGTNIWTPAGSLVIQATPNTGYSFSAWSFSGTGTVTFSNAQSASTTATVAGSGTVTASFALNTYIITVSAGANGQITPGTGSVNYGATPTYTITPNTGYLIASITVDGQAVPVTNASGQTYQFSPVSSTHTISATFSIKTFTITVTAGGNGQISPATGPVNYGATPTYTVTPNTGYSIASISVDGQAVPVTNANGQSYQFNAVTAPHTIAAAFVINTFTITPVAGSGGSISPNTPQIVNYGQNSPTFAVTPNAGYHIVDVKAGNVDLGAVTSYKYTNVQANSTLSATFAINSYTITVNSGANGQITPGTGSVNYGSTPIYTITPATGYHIVSITVNGALVAVTNSSGQSYQFSAVSADGSIGATFAANTYTITVTAGANGRITPSTGSVAYGATPTYTISPNHDYLIGSITVDGRVVPVTAPAGQTYQFSPVFAPHTITATFILTG